jgi:hypothetical protein
MRQPAVRGAEKMAAGAGEDAGEGAEEIAQGGKERRIAIV